MMDRTARLLGISGPRIRNIWPHTPGLIMVTLGAGFLALLVLLPLASMLQFAFSSGPAVFWENISSSTALFSLRFSVILALATTAVNGVLGTVVAMVLERHQFPFRGFFEILVDLPLIIPATAAGLTILMLYGSLGILGKLFGEAGITIMSAFPAILVAHVFMTLPFVVRAVGRALATIDSTEQDAAKILGANEVQVFAKVIFPAIKSALITGCVFTFIRSMGELGATIIIAGNLALNSQTAPLFVFSEFNEGNLIAANSMAVVLVIISVGLFLGFKLSNKLLARKGNFDGERSIPQES